VWVFVCGVACGRPLVASSDELPQSPQELSSPTPSPVPSPSPAGGGLSRWNGRGGGFSLAVSPIYKPKITSSDRLDTGKLTHYDASVEFPSLLTIGFRWTQGDIPLVYTYDSSTFVTQRSSGASLAVYTLYFGANVPVNNPYSWLGPVQFFIPVFVGPGLLLVRANSGVFNGFTVDAAAGLGARVYSWSFFRAEVSALYHQGIPFHTISKNTTTDVTVRNSAGQDLKGSLGGVEMRIGLSLILPATPREGQE
jgi:hypothetical protein